MQRKAWGTLLSACFLALALHQPTAWAQVQSPIHSSAQSPNLTLAQNQRQPGNLDNPPVIDPNSLQAPALTTPLLPCNWRNDSNPFRDPLKTLPARLQKPLPWQVQLPPTFAPGPTANTSVAGLAGSSYPAKPRPWDADNSAWPELDMALALHLALCHNPQIRLSWSQIAQQAAALGQARAAWLPQLSGTTGRMRDHLHYPDGGMFYPDSSTRTSSSSLSLSWRLFDFGSRSARTDAAGYQLQAAIASQDAAILKALGDALQTYFDAQNAQARWQISKAILPLNERNLQASERRYSHGAASQTDVLEAQSAKAQTELDISRAQGDYRKALAALVFTLGLPANTPYRLSPLPQPSGIASSGDSGLNTDLGSDINSPHSIPSSPASPPAQKTPSKRRNPTSSTWDFKLLQRDLDGWLEQARSQHPAIVAARANWQAALAAIKVAQSDGLPTVDVNYNYYRNGRPNQSLSSISSHERLIGITLTVPIFDGFSTTYKVRQAQANAEEKAITYQNAEEQSLQEVIQMHTDAQVALLNLKAAHALEVAASQVSTSLQNQYDKGAADILQLNQATEKYRQAQMQQIQALAEWHRASLHLWLLDLALQPR